MYVVKVIAPATLEAGYKFDATIDGKTFTVTVPKHVEEGEEFEVPYPDDEEEEEESLKEEIELDTPVGEWRHGLFSCCDVLTQATFWMGCLLCPIHLAQILTRLSLNWKGQKGTLEEASMTFNVLVITFVIVLYLFMIPIVGPIAAFGFWMLWVYIGTNARGYMRENYEIPPMCSMFGAKADDCCIMFWCGCCSTIQMARHTHDDKEYPGTCFTTNGLDIEAPEIKETFSTETISEQDSNDSDEASDKLSESDTPSVASLSDQMEL